MNPSPLWRLPAPLFAAVVISSACSPAKKYRPTPHTDDPSTYVVSDPSPDQTSSPTSSPEAYLALKDGLYEAKLFDGRCSAVVDVSEDLDREKASFTLLCNDGHDVLAERHDGYIHDGILNKQVTFHSSSCNEYPYSGDDKGAAIEALDEKGSMIRFGEQNFARVTSGSPVVEALKGIAERKFRFVIGCFVDGNIRNFKSTSYYN